MRRPMPSPSNAKRHGLVQLGGLALAGALWLGGCATAPAPAPAVSPTPRFSSAQVAVLRQLGFAEVTEGWELNLAGKVLFAFNGEHLGTEGQQTIANLADTLRQAALTQLRIEGHADHVGDAAYNQRLSARRAEVVAREFVARGLPVNRIETRGLGASMPIADNTTEAGRTQNRRVVILVRGD
jgi:outer membrane protein OmpA-like peptidoglycan-associated protein